MQRLEVSGAVRPLQWSLGVKGLTTTQLTNQTLYGATTVQKTKTQRERTFTSPDRQSLHVDSLIV